MLNAWHLPVPPFAILRGNYLYLTLWLESDDPPEQVMLRAEPDNEELLQAMESQQIGRYRRYHTALALDEGQPARRYCFKLLWETHQRWVGPLGVSELQPASLQQFSLYAPDPDPEWVTDQVFYQIFPDRFASSGGPHLIQSGSYYHHAEGREVKRCDWEDPIESEGSPSTFYGGDLDGIISKLPYLQKLGVTALYLNPVFKAPSVHKYDTEDYYQVDPYLGGNEALVRLREQTREFGIRLMLDGVFNHTGDSSPWFDRHQQHHNGAFGNEEAPTRSWYSFWPDGSTCDWKGFSSLPKLDYASDGVVEQIYRGQDSVVRHWLRPPYSIDAWRLDVIHMLGEGGGAKRNLHHLAGIKQAIREENPDAYILGEHFNDAREWLHAGVEDGAMNYRGFVTPVWAFLANVDNAGDPMALSAEACAEWVESYRAGLPHQVQLRQFNQLDSHDTSRFITLLEGNRARMAMAVVWQFCWIGVPCIYYGDEIGLDGENDPYCRKTFPWHKERWDADLLGLYTRLAALRHDSPALRRGGCKVLHAEGDTLVFMRRYEQEQIVVALQRNRAANVALPLTPMLEGAEWQALEGEGVLTSHSGGLTLALPGESVTLWRGQAKA
ncbi:maltodextrin glucosidase [Nissabacter sp. SGAir0207]|uniref:maltodextrin glucosidase n=1 Tax=Nissabacter sp. SGAir0207 TaxID=2126321 RepID=UPI0010CCDF53|nr:maltodextrin glucosidase [Nissabacter sp. SGAir0207]QCR36931.1 maltodextrin glucosidase [Nissabacter sp. SGAir0207]